MSERGMSEKGAQFGIGSLVTSSAERDAVHIAVAPVIATEDLHPGQSITLVEGSNMRVHRVAVEKAVGIVDPFLKDMVKAGERFYMFLKPNTITGLHHQWQHPAFIYSDDLMPNLSPYQQAQVRKVSEVIIGNSEAWLRDFAERWHMNYNDLIENARERARQGQFNIYIVADGRDLHSAAELGEDHDLFWSHLENMTGEDFGEEHRKNFGWSCSC